MTVNEMMAGLPVELAAGGEAAGTAVTGGYAGDLLSNAMAQARAGDVWITMQGHQNIVAVASLAGLAAVIVAGGVQPDRDAIAKADREGIVLLTSALPVFELAGRLYRLGVMGQ